MAINKSTNNKVGEDVEKREPLHTDGGNVNWCNHCGKQYRDASKMKNKNTIQSSNSGYLENTKTLIWKDIWLIYVHCIIIYSSQDIEAA